MARTRTKQEVRDFLNGLVGQRVNAKSGIYSGQCVSLIKALLEFFDLPNPYAGRGNAISVNDTLLREGLATNGKGWLTIVVNRDMGRIFENGVWNNYGHIWIDLQGEANFEQNGARALYTTKNTRPISQGQQFVNLDKYITENDDMITANDTAPVRVVMSEVEGWDLHAIHSGKHDSQIMGAWQGKTWQQFIMHCWTVQPKHRGYLVEDINKLTTQINELSKRPTQAELDALKVTAAQAQANADEAEKTAAEAVAKANELVKQNEEDKANADTWLRRLGQFLAKYWVAK